MNETRGTGWVERKLPDTDAASSEFCCRKDWWESGRCAFLPLLQPGPTTGQTTLPGEIELSTILLPFQFLDTLRRLPGITRNNNQIKRWLFERRREEELKNIRWEKKGKEERETKSMIIRKEAKLYSRWSRPLIRLHKSKGGKRRERGG